MPLDRGAEALIAMARASGRAPVEELSIAEARAAVKASIAFLNGDPVAMREVRDFEVAAAPTSLSARLFTPPELDQGGTSAGVIFFHGGGWAVGDMDTHDQLCRKLSRAGRCRVVSVDYRLAPEHKFPAAVNDAAAAIRWVYDNAAMLNIDPARIGVGGDSAGGNLAAVMALMSRDGDVPPLTFQVLLYPACDLTTSHPSYARNGEGYLLTATSMRYFIGCYLPTAEAADDWRASPLKAVSLEGVAPALVVTAGRDPLCDEGLAYAARLASQGVHLELVHLPGQIHGLLTASAVVIEAEDAIRRVGQFIRSMTSKSADAAKV